LQKDGYGRNVALNIEKLGVPNHSWNAVKLNQKWYVCDATWSSGYTLITSESTNFIHKYNDGYFLTNPELFVKNHYPLNEKWTLLESPPSSQEFLKAPFIYDETFINKIIPLEPKKLMTTIKESQFLNFKFKTLKKIDRKKIKLEIINRSSKKIVDPIFMYSPKDDIITFKYQFTKKGKFDVHVKIDEDIISTFTVKNKKSNKK